MSPLRVLRGLVFGAMGGLVGWVLVELFFRPDRFEQPGGAAALTTATEQGFLGVALGVPIGFFLGVSEGIAEGTAGRFRRAVLSFSALGAVGGFMGLYFGQILFSLLGGKVDLQEIAAHEFFPQILARSMAWMLIGLFLGGVFGVPSLSARRMWNGAVGGAIGGFLGGFIFQVLVFTGLVQGMQVRFLGFVIIGASIGFFINLIVEAMKQVWVKVLVGRNEGREYVLDTPLAYVGRDELAEVPVFLDPAVPKRLASFRLTGGRYALHPESSGLPIRVNGQPLTPGHVLRDGDAIQFGRVSLGYYEKATATGRTRPVDALQFSEPGLAARSAGAVSGLAAGACPYCGQAPDPVTGACACSVPAEAGYAGGFPGDTMPAPAVYPPQGAYAAGGGVPDPGYAATMMEPGALGDYPPADGGAGPRLVVTDGPLAGQVISLAGQEITIGREPSQDVALTGDGTASRRHARLLATDTGWVLRDEGSANGTWINGVRVQEQPLFPGDTIRIGGTFLRFET